MTSKLILFEVIIVNVYLICILVIFMKSITRLWSITHKYTIDKKKKIINKI